MSYVDLKDKVDKWLDFISTDEFFVEGINEAKESSLLIDNADYAKLKEELLENLISKKRYAFTKHYVIPMNVEELVGEFYPEEIAILNYASFTSPGGLFMDGKIAQEESICHFTGMYPVLRDNYSVNPYLYNLSRKNNGKYTHSFIVMKVPYKSKDKMGKVCIISSAAPNYTSYKKYNNRSITEEELNIAMRERQELVYLIAGLLNVETFVAGPWGCGVFLGDPVKVAKNWKHCSEKYPGLFKRIIHTCPDMNSKNYKSFISIFPD